MQHKIDKANHLIHFIKNNNTCRSKQLLGYFGESTAENCGICDVCLAKKRTLKSNGIQEKIVDVLKEHSELSSQQIIQFLDSEENEILIHLRTLLAKELIGLNNHNKFYLK